MLFRRRRKLGLLERFRLFIWPQRSFARSFQYFAMRVLRLKATPHAIAAGVAAGVFASWTPLLGFHFILSFAIAYVLAGNLIAAGLGTAFGNPLSFPLIWTTTYKLGHWILNGREVEHVDVDLLQLLRDVEFTQLWAPVLKPMIVGCVVPGVVTGLAFYAVTFVAVRRFQTRRQRLLANRARERGLLARAIAPGGGDAVKERP